MMNTFTQNRAFALNDLMSVAVCDRTCADLLDIYNMDRRVTLEASTGMSFCTKLKRIFLGK